MTDHEMANTLLNYGIALGADGMTYQQAMDYTMRDIAAIREDERKANHSPGAGNMVAAKLVEDIRSGGFAFNANDPEDRGPNGDDYHFTLTDTEAATLIESYSRRVPRAMLEEIEKQAFEYCKEPFLSYETLDAIAARYGVKIEEEGK